ncbi:MAG TPA: hypothetical protein VFE62_01660 [Gemmataceae bacterium]|nr:hypothetical protein [Gemmataceae bacterium]
MSATEALARIKAKIAGKSRENRKFSVRPKTPAEIEASPLNDDSTHVEGASGEGVMVHSVSLAEVERKDVLAVGNAIPMAKVNADPRLKMIIRGALAGWKDFIALAVEDLDYLIAAFEAPPAPSPMAKSPPAPPADKDKK